VSEREDRLNALQEAVDAWAAFRTNQVEKHVEFLKGLRQSRGELTNRAVQAAETLLVDEISTFLA
jgi:hypothetical protein